jgi:hypothetical protein
LDCHRIQPFQHLDFHRIQPFQDLDRHRTTITTFGLPHHATISTLVSMKIQMLCSRCWFHLVRQICVHLKELYNCVGYTASNEWSLLCWEEQWSVLC